MRILYRVAPGGGADPVDVEVRLADDATVGEAADAIAAHLADRGQTVPRSATLLDTTRRAAPERAAPVVTAAPPSGTTVQLVEASTGPPEPPLASPVLLAATDGAGDLRLPYGPSTVGTARFDVGDRIVVRSTGSPDRLEVDGAPVRGSMRIEPGAVMHMGHPPHAGRSLVLRCDGPLRPPPTSGPIRPHAHVRAQRPDATPRPVEFPTPPGPQRTPGFPVLSAVVPLLMGVVLWWVTGNLAVAGFVLFSFVFVVASGLESRRESRADARFRTATFRTDLADAADRLTVSRHREAADARAASPSAADVATWLGSGPGIDATDPRQRERVWERSPASPGALTVRVGLHITAGRDPAVVHRGGRAELRRELDATVASLDAVELPAVVDLDDAVGLALVGHGERPAAAARAVVAQLAGLVAPADLAVEVLAAPDRRATWSWVRWLPHAAPDAGRGPGARRLLVIDDPGPTAGRDDGPAAILRRRLDDEPGLRVLWLDHGPAGLPDAVGAVVHLSDTDTLRIGDAPATALAPETLSTDAAEPMARALAPLVDHAGADGDPLPAGGVALRDVLAEPSLPTDTAAVASRWRIDGSGGRRPGVAGLAAPIGVAGGGVLSLDLVRDGPHGLVAGTTGAGKSELLRTLVASMALHHGPERLTFLLVDYKGGSAFRSLAALPHTVGLVTDLTPALASRALVSLRAEVRHREALVASGGVTDVLDLPPDEAIPALVVVIDELATLVRELPDFVDGLVDLAQRGRSLGIHLLLATQRPGGVVSDAVRANVSFRIALRVADEDDSRDVIDGPAAAHLPRDRPGRAVLRTGPRHTVELQVAHTGGPALAPPRATCWDLSPVGVPDPAAPSGRSGPDDSTATPVTEIDAVVATCRAASARLGLAPPRRPWVEAPGAGLTAGDLPPPRTGTELVIGLVDDPDAQSVGALSIDPTERGGLVVVGAAGSGRTTTLAMLAHAAGTHPDGTFVVYGIDGGRDLGRVRSAPGVGDVVQADDAERTLRLLRGLDAERRQRATGAASGRPVATGGPGRPRVLLLVDGIAAVEDRHARVNRGEALDLLTTLAADGRGRGIHVAVTAGRRSDVPPALWAALDRRLTLRCAGPDEASLAGVPVELGDPDTPPGRGVLDGLVVQVARPPDGPRDPDRSAAPPTTTAPEVPSLPRTVPWSVVDTGRDDGAPWCLALGRAADSLGPVHLDLADHHALVAGPPRSGRTTALDLVVAQARRVGTTTARIDGRDDDADVVTATLVRLVDGPVDAATLLAVDDLPDLLDGPAATDVDDLLVRILGLARHRPVRIVATGEADALGRCYAESVRRLRSGRTGILLRPDPDLHPGLLHTVLPLHDELPPAPGRGWLVTVDGPRAVQLALPPVRTPGPRPTDPPG